MHGQTVWHAPPSRGAAVACTLQLGSSGALAAELALPVVGDLRAADVAAGGEGAPIVPFAHWFFTPRGHPPRAVVNVGGIANVTFVDDAVERVLASDIGPGMMVTDALVRASTGGAAEIDEDGRFSAGGGIDDAVVGHVLAHPFFARPLPRTTGREDFGGELVAALLARFARVPAATLVRSSLFATARAIVDAVRARSDAGEIVLTGGGAKHGGLRELVGELAAPLPVRVLEGGPLAPSHHEPAAMALIAARTLARLPSSLPQVTGAPARVLGHIHWP
jgi:anhydro-N-acetylmuramic acid kinase